MTDSSSWLASATPDIFETLSLADKGIVPSFPLPEFISILKESLKQETLDIKIDQTNFIEAKHFFDHLGEKTISLPLKLSPIEENFFFLIAENDINTLILSMQELPQDNCLPIQDESITKGLLTYFALEAIHAFMQLNPYKDLQLKISEGKLNALSAFAIHLTITIKTNTFKTTILAPEKFYQIFQTHFKFITPTLENLNDIQNVNIPITINTGSISLNQKEIESIEEGDFLIVKNSFYKPNEKKGSFQMCIGKSPLFQIKLQKEGVKILDYLYFYKEDSMDDDDAHSPLGDNFDNQDNDELLDKNLDDQTTNHLDDQDPEKKPIDQEHKENLDQNPDNNQNPPINNEDKLINNENVPPTTPSEEQTNNSTEENIDNFLKDDENENSESNTLMHPEKTPLGNLPLTVQMEVARFSLSLEELKKLSPGYKLPINIDPISVNLVISGKSIGTGEIIQVGETIGVRVIELY